MGKKSREKWERRLASVALASQPQEGKKSGIESWSPWIATFLLNGAGLAVSNGPWEISGLLFVIGVPCIWIGAFSWFRSSKSLLGKALPAAFGLALTVSTCWIANRVMHIPIAMTETNQKKFTAALAAIPSKPDLVLMSCSASNEDSCAFAEQFIPLFQRAGWKVQGPQVSRETLGRYGKEIVVADYGPPLVDPQNPDQGVWTQLLPWRWGEDAAFRALGMNTHSVNDTALSKTNTRIHFGTVPTRSLIEVLKAWI